MRAPQRPAAQAAQGELAEQHFQVFQHRAHAARRLRQQGIEELQVGAEQGFVAKTVGRRGRGAEHQFNDRARGLGGQFQRGLNQIRNDVLADFLGHQRRMVDPGGDQIVALAQRFQGSSALEVIVQTARAEYPGCFMPRSMEAFLQLRGKRVDQFLIVFEIDAHDKPL